MNSALKPVLTTSPAQNPPTTTQLNKPMHPQTTPATYGQPSTHVSQTIMNLPHNNPNIAHSHSHPNPAHQPNHFPLNVPSAPQHYSSSSSTIPASNHPVANTTQASSGGQSFSLNKNVSYSSGYQPNLGHPPNQNPIPPVNQTLVATQPPQIAAVPAAISLDKPQSNGTPEIKSPPKTEVLENHAPLAKEKLQLPANQEKPSEPAPDEKSSPSVSPAQNQVKEESSIVEETKVSVASTTETAPSVVNLSPAAVATASNQNPEDAASINASNAKTEVTPRNSAERKEVSASVSNADTPESGTPPKSKDKDQKHAANSKSSVVTPRTPTRKSKTSKAEADTSKSSKIDNKSPPVQKSPSLAIKTKRARIRTQPYQSPLPEIEIITKISSSVPRNKNSDDKLIVFYKNEFLAVRNSEGGFYVCQAVQNIYKSSPKIKIRWLSQDKSDKSGEVYTPDFYDVTDFDCILTNLNLTRIDKGKFRLPSSEKVRTDSILKRSLAVEKGEVTSPSLTEEHPDGIDVSLYKQESQLKKRKSTKRRASSPLKSGQQSKKVKAPEQSATTPSPKTVKKNANSQKTSSVEKKPAASSRTDRAKRRNDIQSHNNKIAQIVDQKKARVLAKVVRKAVGSTGRSHQLNKNSKVLKSTASKVQTPPPKAATKKTKRSSKK